MQDMMSDAELRRWAIQTVVANDCLDDCHDTSTICRKAMEFVDFVRDGRLPPELKPIGCRPH